MYKINFVGERKFSKASKDIYKELIKCFYKETEEFAQSNYSILDYCDEFSLRGKTASELMKYKGSDDEIFKVAHETLTRLMCGDHYDH